jgi:uncharacterized protein (TIGR00251 family)
VIDVREAPGTSHDTAPGGVSFSVRVQPRASSNEITGEWQGALRVRLAAPPLDGRANEVLRHLLAERLKVPLAAVRIVRGERSRTKHVEVRGVTSAQVRRLAPEHIPHAAN